jgi:hypothetical protein
MIPDIGLIGHARAGKDTAAGLLTATYGHRRIAFADPVRDLLARVNPWVTPGVRLSTVLDSAGGWDDAKDIPEVRRLLQECGTSARDILGDNVWVQVAFGRMWRRGEPIVVTDVRFYNEAVALRDHGFLLIRLTRAAAPPIRPHVSENNLDGYPVDHTFANDGDLDGLAAFLGATVELYDGPSPTPRLEIVRPVGGNTGEDIAA